MTASPCWAWSPWKSKNFQACHRLQRLPQSKFTLFEGYVLKQWELTLDEITLYSIRYWDYINSYIKHSELAVVVHTCNSSTQEAAAGGSQVWGQPELHHETLSKKTNIIHLIKIKPLWCHILHSLFLSLKHNISPSICLFLFLQTLSS
jgi:hypothetical protein